MVLVLYFALLGTVFPYVFRFTANETLAYVIAVGSVVVSTIVFLSDSEVSTCLLQSLYRSPHILLFCLFLVLSQLVVSYVHPVLQWSDVLKTFGYVCVALAGYLVFPIAISRRMVEQWLFLLMGVGALTSLLGIMGVVTGITRILGIEIRPSDFIGPLGIYSTSSIFHSPNMFAFSAFLGAVSAYDLFKRRKYGVVAMFALGLCVLGIFLSWSRAMYLALFVAFPAQLLVGRSLRWKLGAFLGLVFLAAIVLVVLLSVPTLFKMVLGQGLAGRQVYWLAALRAIGERPLFGYGINQNREAIFLHGGWKWRSDKMIGAHNSILDFTVQGGVLVGVLYVGTILVSLRRLSQARLDGQLKRTLG